MLLTNVELFLFCRQCRYYGLAILFTTAAAYLYCFRGRNLWGLSLVLAGLLASQYLNYAAAIGCLLVDYAVWGRHDRPHRLAAVGRAGRAAGDRGIGRLLDLEPGRPPARGRG